MRVLVYAIVPEQPARESDGHSWTFRPVREPSLDFGEADLVILPARPTLSGESIEHHAGTQLLANRIVAAGNAGKLVCLVYAREDLSADQFVAGRLLARWRMNFGWKTDTLKYVYAREFEGYLNEYGIPGATFSGRTGLLAISGPAWVPVEVSAFALAEGTGLIYMVPGNVVRGSELNLVAALASSIQAHSSRILRPASAPIVESFKFTAESEIGNQRDEKQAELESLDAQLAGYDAKKDILFLRDNPLADRVPAWITAHLGLQTERAEEYIEDFWLLDEEGKQAVICEAKGLNQNVRREHIYQVVMHRAERDLPDDHPALLVVNTFADAVTEDEKGRQRVSPRECQTAVKEHVLIVRTLDLVRLLDQLEQGIVTTDEIWQLLANEIGWLKVDGTTRQVVKA